MQWFVSCHVRSRTTPVGAPKSATLWFGSFYSGRKMKILLLSPKCQIRGLNNSYEHWPWSQMLTQYPLEDLFKSGVRAHHPRKPVWPTLGSPWWAGAECESWLCWLKACAARTAVIILTGESQWTVSYSVVKSWPCPWCCPASLHKFAGHRDKCKTAPCPFFSPRKAPGTEALPS